MNEILMNSLALVLLVAGFVALIRYVRSDAFAGPGVGHRDTDALDKVLRPRADIPAA